MTLYRAEEDICGWKRLLSNLAERSSQVPPNKRCRLPQVRGCGRRASVDFARRTPLNASTLSPLILARNFARVCCGGWKRHRLCSLDRRYIDFTGYIKHLGFFQSNRRYGTRARSALFTRSQLNTVGGLLSMVSTWSDTQSRLCFGACHVSRVAQTYGGAVGFFTASAVCSTCMCAATTRH